MLFSWLEETVDPHLDISITEAAVFMFFLLFDHGIELSPDDISFSGNHDHF